MFILETMVPRVDLEGVSATCANVSALPLNVRNFVSVVGAFDSFLHSLEATSGLDVGGGEPLSRNARRNKNRRNGANGSDLNGGGWTVDIP